MKVITINLFFYLIKNAQILKEWFIKNGKCAVGWITARIKNVGQSCQVHVG